MWLTDGRDLIRLSQSRAEDQPTVDALVRALRGSEVQIHQTVLRQLVPRVRGWVRAMVGPATESDDIAQEALCQIAEALFRYEGRSSVSTFAHRITMRAATRMRRKRPPARSVDAAELSTAEPSPALQVERRARLVRLYVHLDRMADRRRTAIVLCDIEGLTPKEAAEVAGCSGNAMRNRLFQARAELRERVARDPLLEGSEGSP